MTQPDTAGVIAPPPLLALGALLIGLLLDWVAPAYLLTVMFTVETRVVLALLLIGAGGTLAVWAVIGLRAAQTAVEPWKPTTALVRAGPYLYVRNPIYVGLIMVMAGLALALASDWTLVMTVALALIIHHGVVKREERYLTAKFGDDYRLYREAVSRYGWPRL